MNDIEKIKSKLDITEIIGEHITLKKAGRNYKVLCPFHNEKSPSFVVSPERQIWHCFGCGKGGDIFRFLMEHENIEFPESLKYLADRAGVKLSGPIYKTGQEKKREIIYALNHLTAQFYNFILTKHPVGKKALYYLDKKRRVGNALIKTFNLGFSPEKPDALVNYLTKKKKYREQDLIEAGLAYRRNGKIFDFFRNRIMFPITDVHNNIIAFSGRSLPDPSSKQEALPKYLNTKETIVYTKGNTLYGLSIVKEEVKKKSKVIVVEGEFDVISSFREGIDNVVAVKGTALTENQIKILKRYAPKIALCFDKDEAGSEAQKRSISILEKEGIMTSVIIPPQGKDADETLSSNPLLFKKAVKNDINIYDFVIDSAIELFDKKTPEGKKNILDKTLPFMALIENEVIKEHYIKKIAEKIDSSFDAVSKQMAKIEDKNIKREAVVSKKILPREEILSEYVLALIIQSENPISNLKRVSEIMNGVEFPILSFEKIFAALKRGVDEKFDAKKFVKGLPEELRSAFDRAYLSPLPEFKDNEQKTKELEQAAKELKTVAIKSMLKKISDKIKKEEDNKNEEALEKLNIEFDRLTRFLGTISPKS